MEGPQIHIEQDYASYNIKIWFREHRGDTIIYWYMGEEGYMIEQALKTNEAFTEEGKPKPLLVLPEPLWRVMGQAIVDRLSHDGVKLSNDHKVHGEIESMRLHLEDMRKIAFKQLKIENDAKN